MNKRFYIYLFLSVVVIFVIGFTIGQKPVFAEHLYTKIGTLWPLGGYGWMSESLGSAPGCLAPNVKVQVFFRDAVTGNLISSSSITPFSLLVTDWDPATSIETNVVTVSNTNPLVVGCLPAISASHYYWFNVGTPISGTDTYNRYSEPGYAFLSSSLVNTTLNRTIWMTTEGVSPNTKQVSPPDQTRINWRNFDQLSFKSHLRASSLGNSSPSISSLKVQLYKRVPSVSTTWTTFTGPWSSDTDVNVAYPAISDGIYSWNFYATDNLGKLLTPGVMQDLGIDRVAPTVSCTSSLVGSNIQVSLTSSDSLSGVGYGQVQVKDGAGAWTDLPVGSGAYSGNVNYAYTSGHFYTFQFRAADITTDSAAGDRGFGHSNASSYVSCGAAITGPPSVPTGMTTTKPACISTAQTLPNDTAFNWTSSPGLIYQIQISNPTSNYAKYVTTSGVPVDVSTVGTIQNIVLRSGGQNYTSVPTVTIRTDLSGGSGFGATATAAIDGSGHVTGVTVTNPGSGYGLVGVPLAVISGGGGSGASAYVEGVIPAAGTGTTTSASSQALLKGGYWTYGPGTNGVDAGTPNFTVPYVLPTNSAQNYILFYPGQPYRWRVRAGTVIGGIASWSGWSADTSFTVPACPMTYDLQVEFVNSTWQDSANNFIHPGMSFQPNDTARVDVKVTNLNTIGSASPISDLYIYYQSAGVPICPTAAAAAPPDAVGTLQGYSIPSIPSGGTNFVTIPVTFRIGTSGSTAYAVADPKCLIDASPWTNNVAMQTYSVNALGFFETQGGDVGSAGTSAGDNISVSFDSSTITPTALYQSDYAVAANHIGSKVSTKKWKLGSYVSKQVPAGGIYDYFRGRFPQPTPSVSTCDFVITKPVSYCNGNFTFTNTGPLAKTAPAWDGVVFVDGNLSIETNLVLNPDITLIFIVSGNITVSLGVTEIDGVFIGKQGFTDSNVAASASGVGPTGFLKVKGGVYVDANGGALDLRRYFITPADNRSKPSDQFIFDPKYLAKPSLINLIGVKSIKWTEINP